MKPIILFDGECNLCDTSVQFILKRDHGYYQFASLQGIKGQELIQKHRLPSDLNSVVVIEEGVPYIKSDAALRITKHLNWCVAARIHLPFFTACGKRSSHMISLQNTVTNGSDRSNNVCCLQKKHGHDSTIRSG